MRMRNGRLTKRSNDTKDEMTVDIFEADIIECYRSGYDSDLIECWIQVQDHKSQVKLSSSGFFIGIQGFIMIC